MNWLFSKLLTDAIFFDIIFAFIPISVGVALMALSRIRFAVPLRHVAISNTNPQKRYLPGWQWGLSPSDCTVISLDPKTIKIPSPSSSTESDHIEIGTPDDGVLGVKVTLVYQPNDSTSHSLVTFQKSTNFEDILTSRIHSALVSWAWQKPLPATSRRAVASKADAEQAIASKLTLFPTETLIALGDTENRYAVSDLGIIIRDVHIVDFWEIKKGTGKPNWGDDDIAFDAAKVRQRLKQKVSSVSDLRKEREALVAEFPDEAEYIENLYDEERIRSMEHRDR